MDLENYISFQIFISLQNYRLRKKVYKSILYFSVLGTLLITNLPSYDSDAKTHGSADDHSTAYTLSSCSSYVAMTPSAGGEDDLKKVECELIFGCENI